MHLGKSLLPTKPWMRLDIVDVNANLRVRVKALAHQVKCIFRWLESKRFREEYSSFDCVPDSGKRGNTGEKVRQ